MKNSPPITKQSAPPAPKPKKFSYGAHVRANFAKHPKAMKILK